MKALILASGTGTRLRPLTDTLPKTMVRVGDTELVARIADSLVSNGVTDVVMTTGHEEEKLKKFMSEKYPQLRITYVNNPEYASTNYIYSQWLARDVLKGDDFVTFHADLLIAPELITKVIESPRSAVLVQEGEAPSAKDFNARVEDGLVKEVRTKMTGPGVSFCAPLYKLMQADMERWMQSIDGFVKEGKLQNYAEDAFNAMSPQFALQPVYFGAHELCMEVDDFEDLEKAERLLKK